MVYIPKYIYCYNVYLKKGLSLLVVYRGMNGWMDGWMDGREGGTSMYYSLLMFTIV